MIIICVSAVPTPSAGNISSVWRVCNVLACVKSRRLWTTESFNGNSGRNATCRYWYAVCVA